MVDNKMINNNGRQYKIDKQRVSKRVIVVERQLINFSAISWREQVNVHWNDDEVRFVLDQHA